MRIRTRSRPVRICSPRRMWKTWCASAICRPSAGLRLQMGKGRHQREPRCSADAYHRMGIFHPGRNVWRVEQASRVAVLIDAGSFFGAVRAALLQARRSVFVIGWDLDSRTRLVGEDCDPHDGWPITLRAFLVRLVSERPDLTVYLLGWDFALLYALEREPLPSLTLGWNTPDRVRSRLDSTLPVGASHHQKIIVIDDALAFPGGLDVTIRRWDTCEHAL